MNSIPHNSVKGSFHLTLSPVTSMDFS